MPADITLPKRIDTAILAEWQGFLLMLDARSCYGTMITRFSTKESVYRCEFSSAVEHSPFKGEALGSNPRTRTKGAL